MKKNMKRWLALLLAVCMVATSAVYTNGTSLKATGEESSEGVDAGTPAPASDTGEGTAAPAENTTQEEIPIEPQQPAPVEEPAAEPAAEPSPAPETNETPAADTPAVEEPQTPAETPAEEAPEETPAEKKYNVALNKPASDGGEIVSWTAADKSDKKKVSYDGNGQYKLEIKEGAGFWFEITADENHEVEKVTDQNGNTVAPKTVDGKISTYEILNVDADKAFTVVYKEVVQEEETPEINEEVKMPAAEFTEKVSGLDITAKAPEGIFPEGTIMTVTAIDDDEAVSAVENILEKGNAVADIQAVDISFKDKDGNKIQPLKEIKVNISGISVEGKNKAIYHKDNSGEINKVQNIEGKATTAEFTADNFSPFYIVGIKREENGDQEKEKEIYTESAAEENVEVAIEYYDQNNNRIENSGMPSSGSIPSGIIEKNIQIVNGYSFMRAVLSGGDNRISYARKIDGLIYYSVEENPNGAYSQLSASEQIVLQYKKLDNEVNVITSTSGAKDVPGNEIVSSPVAVEKGKAFSVKVSHARGYEVYVTASGLTVTQDEFDYNTFTVNVPENRLEAVEVNVEFTQLKSVSFEKGVWGTQLNTHSNRYTLGNCDIGEKQLPDDGSGVEFTFRFTTKTTKNWWLDSFKINDVYLKIPDKEKGSSAVTTLYFDKTGSCQAVIKVTDVKGKGNPERSYEIKFTGVKENLEITAANLNNVSWPEVIPTADRGIDFKAFTTDGGQPKDETWLNRPFQTAEGYKPIFEFSLKPGYTNLEVYINGKSVALPQSTGKNYVDGKVATIEKLENGYRVQFLGNNPTFQTLQLTCEKKNYSLKYDPAQGAGEITDSHKYNVDNPLAVVTGKLPKAPEGKFFIGWKMDGDSSGKVYYAGDVIDFVNGGFEKLIDDKDLSLTLTAQYADNFGDGEAISTPVNVYKEVIGSTGSDTEYQLDEEVSFSVKSYEGREVIYLDMPEFGGYTFNGKKSNIRITAGVGQDGELNAIALYYDLKEYKINYDLNCDEADVSGKVPEGGSYKKGSTVTVGTSELARPGYEFLGWSTDKGASAKEYSAGDRFAMPGSDTTLYAIWKANKAMVSVWFYRTVKSEGLYYITQKGTLSREENGDNKYSKQISSANKSGYSEADIRKYAEEAYGLTEEIDRYKTYEIYVLHEGASAWDMEPIDLDTYIIQDGDDIRYHVVPEAAHKVSYTAGTNSSGSSEDGYYYKSDEIAVKDIENTGVKPDKGFKFDHWEPTSGSIVEGKYIMGDKDVEIQAICVKDETKWHNISYLPGTEDVVKGMPKDETDVLEGSVQYVSPVVPTRFGYLFEGWKPVTEGIAVRDNQFTMPAEDVVFEAQWKADQSKWHEIIYRSGTTDSVTGMPENEKMVLEGTEKTVSKAVPQRFGYTFKEWKLLTSEVDVNDSKFIMPSQNVEFEAQWEVDSSKWHNISYLPGTTDTVEKLPQGENSVLEGTEKNTSKLEPIRMGYTFDGWEVSPKTLEIKDNKFIMPEEDVVFTAQWVPDTDTKYIVRHFLQNVSDDEYTEDIDAVQELKGTTHELTEAEAKEYTGFTAKAFEQAEIAPDGSTEIKIYYDRNKYNITYQITGDYFVNNEYVKQTGVKYGASLSLIGNDMYEEGYVWSGWSELPGTMPAGDVTVTGSYQAAEDTKYTVKHFLQNVEDDKYTEDQGAVQELEGTTGKETKAEARTYEGFTVKAFEQKEIARDGSTVVEIYYDRNKYDITYKITGKYFEDEKYTEQTGVKYGAALKLITDDMSRVGYVWSNWSELPETMPAENITVTGSYSAATDTIYTVRHFLQNVEDDEYTEDAKAAQELRGTTGEPTSAQIKNYPGFMVRPFHQDIIAANGSTVVKIYYDRNKYNITYQITGEYFKAEKYAEQTEVKYETPLSLIKDDMTKAGYVWSEWSELPKRMPAEDVTVTGSYSAAADTVYTVKHLLQNVADNGYTEDASEELKGTTHELTEAKAKEYAGFTPKAFAQAEIKSDGSTEVKIYYDRNKYDITYQITGEYFAAEKYAEQTGVKYGTPLSLITDDMEKAGYVWSKWSELPKTMPAENVTVTGSYRAAEDTKYTVKHLLQNVENDEYTEDTEAVQELKGTTHKLTEAEAKEYTGFTAKAFAQEEIKPDGSTEVKIYYDRNKYDITYQITGDYFVNNEYVKQTGVKYGAPLSLIGNNMHEEGYVWSGWSELPGTMPAEDVTVTGSYRAAEDTKYTVKHFLQNIEDDEYTEDQGAVQELEGITGKETKAEARIYEGFTAKAFEQQKILRDGSTVVEIYYDRNKYDIIYQITGEYFDNVEYAKETGIKYGTMLSLIADNMLKEGYIWSGWAGLPQTMPDKEVNVLGYYTAATNTAYNIEYHYQNPDTGLYDISDAGPKREGTTNSTVSIETLDKVPQKDPAHYVFDETVEGTKLEGAVAADGSLTLHVYFALQYKVTGTIDQGSVTNNAQDVRFAKTSAEMSFDAAEGYIINAITVNGELQTVSNDQKKYVYPPQAGVKEDILVQVTTEPRNPEVTVTKYVLNPKPVGEEFTLGEDIEYQVVVENTGNIELRDIVVSDTLKDMENIKSLKPGEKQVYEYKYTVTEEDIKENHKVVNVAAADVPSEPGTGDEVTVITPTEDINKSLQVTKQVTNAHADGAPFALGEEIAYQVMVKNTGNVTLYNVQVEDSLVALEDSIIAELIPNEVKIFNYTYTVTEADIHSENHVVVNAAVASTPEDTDPDSPKDEETIETPVDTPNPKTEVTKEVTSTPANGTAYALGEEISYKVTVKNTGNVTLENIEVTDSLVALEDSIIDSLAPGAEKEFTYTYTVTEADINSENHTVVNAVAAVVPDQPEAGGEDTVETPVDEPREGLDVVKTITSQTEKAYELGEVVTFNVRVTNTGNVTVNDVTVTDELVGETDVIPEIAPGEFVDLTYTYTITETDLETGVINVAVAETPGGTTGEGQVEVNTGDRNPSIDVTKEVTNTPANGEAYVLGETIQYKVTVVNNGNVTLENVTVDDSLVDLQENTIASLAPGAKETFEYSYVVTEEDIKAGNVTNAVTAGGTGQGETEEPEEPKSEDEVVTPVEPENPSVEVNKTVTNTPANGTAYALGEAIDYSVIVKNTGNVTLTNITVEDSLVELTDHVIDSLAPGETREFTYSYSVTEDDIQSGYVRNAATADIPDGPNGNDEIETPTEEANPNLAVEKSIVNPKEEYRIGDRIAYEIVVRNTGNTTLSNVRVTDHLQGAAGQVEFTELAGNTLDGNVVVIASMAPGEEVTLGCEYEVTREDTGNSISNIAAVVSDETPDTPKEDGTEEIPVEDFYTLTIHYVNTAGETVAPDYTGEFAFGDVFAVTSPAVTGYTPEYTVINSGEAGMPAEDLEFTVIYTTDPVVPPIDPTPDNPTPDNPTPDNPTPDNPAPVTPVTPPVTPATPTTPLTPPAPAAVTPGTTVTPPAATPTTTVEPQEAVIEQNEDGNYDLTPVPDEAVPLANKNLADHVCCILHFLIMLLAFIITAFYTRSMKKRQARIFELREELELETVKRQNNSVEDSGNSGRV